MTNLRDMLSQAGIKVEGVDRIHLPQGVVGKSSWVAGAAIIVLGAAIYGAIKLNQPWVLAASVGAVLVIFLVYFVGIIKFANRNPGLALLEGADLLRWRQLELDSAARGLPNPPEAPNIGPPSVTELPPETNDA